MVVTSFQLYNRCALSLEHYSKLTSIHHLFPFHVFVCVCVRACVRACVRVCVRACVRACVCASDVHQCAPVKLDIHQCVPSVCTVLSVTFAGLNFHESCE